MTLPANQNNSNQVQNANVANSEVNSNGSPQGSPQLPKRHHHHHHKRESSSSSAKDSVVDKQEKGGGDSANANVKAENKVLSTQSLQYLPTDSKRRGSSDHGSSGEISRSSSQEPVRERKGSERAKKTPWYSALYPTYKSRNDDFKRLFKDIPVDERLVVDYSCALQRDILVHGRLYVSQDYLCFYATIFRWETQFVVPWKDVTSLTKEKTALVIPNAILVHTNSEKYFLTSFTSRDKAYVMLFRIWQNALMDQPMPAQKMWQYVHSAYGDELGLTSDDDDYVPPLTNGDELLNNNVKIKDSLIQSSGGFRGGEGATFDSGHLRLEVNGGGDAKNSPERAGDSGSGSSQRGTGGDPVPPTPGSPSEPLASDLSDSSLSESGSEKQRTVITCPVEHEGRLMLHMQVAIHVDQLFTHLFTNSKFFFDLHETRKSTDVKQSPWVTNPSTNQKGRTVSHTMQLAQAIGPKHAQVTETQKMLPCSTPGEMYAIEIEASNSGIPYADTFYVTSHACLTRGADPNTSTIAIYCQIKYRKSVWGLVKSYIEKNCWSGMEEYYRDLVKALEIECDRTRRAVVSGVVGTTKRKGCRRRRNPSSKTIPLACVDSEEAPLIQPLPLPSPPPPAVNTVTVTWIVFLTLFVLLVLNAALYYKLWGLEQNERAHYEAARDLDLESLNKAPQTSEEWRYLLQKQEQLHSYEIERWLKIIKASVNLLKRVEESLSALHTSIEGVITDTSRLAVTPGEFPPPPNSEL